MTIQLFISAQGEAFVQMCDADPQPKACEDGVRFICRSPDDFAELLDFLHRHDGLAILGCSAHLAAALLIKACGDKARALAIGQGEAGSGAHQSAPSWA